MSTEENNQEQIANEKEAINSMRNALANMKKALDRNMKLEYELKYMRDSVAGLKNYCPRDVYQYDSTKRVHELFDNLVERATKVLGESA